MLAKGNFRVERVIATGFKSRDANNTFEEVYVPTNIATEEEKDAFYSELWWVINEIPKRDIVIAMDDFNAKAGSSREELEQLAGPFTTTEETSCNGLRLVNLCTSNFFLRKTFFKHKNIYKKTLISPYMCEQKVEISKKSITVLTLNMFRQVEMLITRCDGALTKIIF